MPNPSIFIDTIHLQEAKSSSEIENIITALVVDMVETTSIQGLKRLERIITLMDETALKDKN